MQVNTVFRARGVAAILAALWMAGTALIPEGQAGLD